MNIEAAQKIIDGKPTEAAHLYIDDTGEPRDKHIENLFRDLFEGRPLDAIFRNNFGVYLSELYGEEIEPPAGIFIDAGYCIAWINRFFGPVTVKPCGPPSDDPDFANVRYVARIRLSGSSKRFKPAYAPSMLHAALLSAVFVLRAEAGKRLNAFFKDAMRKSC